MLTILIFSSNRLELLKELLNDITSSKRFKFINLQIVFYDTKFIPNDKFLRKLSSLQNVKLSNEKLNLSGVEKFIKYSKKINTRFLWVLSDDDRIYNNSIEKLLNILKSTNYSGFTLSYESKLKLKNRKFISNNKKISVRSFDLNKDLLFIGLRSSIIYRTKDLKKFLKSRKKKYFTEYIQSNFLINNLNNWGLVSNKILIFRYGNLDNKNKHYIKSRLDQELSGYLPNLKEKVKEKYEFYFNQIFVNHTISWINQNIMSNGKISTINIILKNKKYMIFNFKILIYLITIILLPNFLRNSFKKLYKLINNIQ